MVSVIDNRPKKVNTLMGLHRGSFFMHGGELYQKSDEVSPNGYYRCIRLESGIITCFKGDAVFEFVDNVSITIS